MTLAIHDSNLVFRWRLGDVQSCVQSLQFIVDFVRPGMMDSVSNMLGKIDWVAHSFDLGNVGKTTTHAGNEWDYVGVGKRARVPTSK
jgi:hypothetical protein